jgi:hypothetical protein
VGRAILVFSVIQLSAIAWDLPGSWGWENDGVAPRDFLDGVYGNLRWGHGHRYPLFHNLLLALLCLPALAGSAAFASDTSFEAMANAVVHPAVMTTCALVARVLSVGMCGIMLLVFARISRRLFDGASGRWAVLLAMTNLSVAYYGRTSNLDGPALMWAVLAIDRLLDVVQRGLLRDYVLFGVLGALAVATKDQAYGHFAAVVPAVFLFAPLFGRLPAPRPHWKRTGLGVGAAAAVYGVATGALWDPLGFLYRIRLLTGPNTEDWRAYPRTLAGGAENLSDLFVLQPQFWWPLPVLLLVWAGAIGSAGQPARHGVFGAPFRSIPLLAALGSLVAFTLVVGRAEHRFVLPQGLWLALYGGAGWSAAVEALGARRGRPVRWVAMVAVVVGGAYTASLHWTQWADARWKVTRWLSGLPVHPTVETYGRTVYQPQFDLSAGAPYRVQRVGHRPVARRNALRRGAIEVQADCGRVRERAPEVLVIPEGAAGWLIEGDFSHDGGWRRDASRFFRRAVSDRLGGYRLVWVAEPVTAPWTRAWGLSPVRIHGSTGWRVWVLVRKDWAHRVKPPENHR